MNIVLDLSSIYALFNLPLHELMVRMFFVVGWIPFVAAFVYGAFLLWIFYLENVWWSQQKFVFLAIDIPRNNEQTPKAVENMFSYLSGALSEPSIIEKYWIGQFQLPFSLEIVSIDGYTQYLIHTPVKFREFAETAIYSQYPDAEITEVSDYADHVPTHYPDNEFDIWGCEFEMANNHVYPIKTYQDFEYQYDKASFKDPMASLTDLCSSLVPGEQLWYQIIIKPILLEAVSQGKEEIDKILGDKKSKKNMVDVMADGFISILGAISELIYPIWGDVEEKKKEDKDDILKMMNLKPGDKFKIDAIQDKISKVVFECKLRFIYVMRKEVKNKAKVANGFVGFMKQFMNINLNNLKPEMKYTGTKVDYFFKKKIENRRKGTLLHNYKNRSLTAGRLPYFLNIEELATIWHFPIDEAIKSPLIQKVAGRKSEPPMSLPTEEVATMGQRKTSADFSEIVRTENTPPSSLGEILEAIPAKKERKKKQFEVEIKGQPERVEEQNKPQSVSAVKGAPPENLPFA